MGQQEPYCSICGGPFNLGYGGSDTKWTHDILLLTAAEPDTDGKLVPAPFHCQESAAARRAMRIPASPDQELYFRDKASQTSPELRAFNPKRLDSQTEPGLYGPLIFPIHERCMEIVDQLAFRKEPDHDSPPDTISDETTLLMVLESRFRNGFVIRDSVDHCTTMPEPHGYFGAERCRNVYWEPGDDVEAAAIFEADPGQAGGDTEADSNSLRNRERILKILELARLDDIPRRVPPQRRGCNCSLNT